MDLKARVATELDRLNDQLLIMGGCAEGAIGAAIEALFSRDKSHCRRVYALEERINRAHLKVDDLCWKMLARRSPVANELREILATVKINADLERLGDQAVNVARHVEEFLEGREIQIPKDMMKMTEEVQTMVKISLNSLVSKSRALAEDVICRDDIVDQLKRKISDELAAQMKATSASIDSALTLIMITKSLERMGDHATNIAEDVIFILTGKDIRHHGYKMDSE